MPSITINISDSVLRKLKTRAKRNLLSIREQIENIVRRSMVNYKKGRTPFKIDDKLVGIFSREKRERKKKVKKKNKKYVQNNLERLKPSMFLVAIPAINRSAFFWLKGHFSFITAIRAGNFMHFPFAKISISKSHFLTYNF